MPPKGRICVKEFIVGDNHDLMREGKTSRDNPTYPHKDIYAMLFDLTIVNGTCLIPVFSAVRVVKDSIFPISSFNLSIFEQPERMRVFTDVN
jgi:hypothetical protein